jgi:hypothetical protein
MVEDHLLPYDGDLADISKRFVGCLQGIFRPCQFQEDPVEIAKEKKQKQTEGRKEDQKKNNHLREGIQSLFQRLALLCQLLLRLRILGVTVLVEFISSGREVLGGEH